MATQPLPAPLLSSGEMSWFAADDRLRLPAGATVIREGEPGDTMFVLVRGELSVTVQGKPIDYLLPGSVLGEMAMLDARTRSATAVAVTDVELVRFDQPRFLDLIRQRPEFAAHIMNIMSSRTRRLMEEEVKRQRMDCLLYTS